MQLTHRLACSSLTGLLILILILICCTVTFRTWSCSVALPSFAGFEGTKTTFADDDDDAMDALLGLAPVTSQQQKKKKRKGTFDYFVPISRGFLTGWNSWIVRELVRGWNSTPDFKEIVPHTGFPYDSLNFFPG